MSILSDELANDPLTRGYAGMTDQQAADDLNSFYRPAAATVQSLRQFFLTTRYSGSFLYGRLEFAAQQDIGAVNPLGETVVFTMDHIAACRTMLAILNPTSEFTIDMADADMDALLDDLAFGLGAKVISSANKTALQALSQSAQSRAMELGIPKVKPGHVGAARA